jgi:hypothetical protein
MSNSIIFYLRDEIVGLKKFLWELEMMERKITAREYKSNMEFINRF